MHIDGFKSASKFKLGGWKGSKGMAEPTPTLLLPGKEGGLVYSHVGWHKLDCSRIIKLCTEHSVFQYSTLLMHVQALTGLVVRGKLERNKTKEVPVDWGKPPGRYDPNQQGSCLWGTW